jgi:hypothetical protein
MFKRLCSALRSHSRQSTSIPSLRPLDRAINLADPVRDVKQDSADFAVPLYGTLNVISACGLRPDAPSHPGTRVTTLDGRW